MTSKLTSRQKQVLEFLNEFITAKGYSPRLQDIADDFGWSSPNAAKEHLVALEKKGRVVNTPRGYIPVSAAS